MAQIIRARMAARNITTHALHKQMLERGHKVAIQTLYNFIDGKSDIRSATVAAMFDVLGLTITEEK